MGEGLVTAGEGDLVSQCAWGMGVAVTVHPTSSPQWHYYFKRFYNDVLTLGGGESLLALNLSFLNYKMGPVEA